VFFFKLFESENALLAEEKFSNQRKALDLLVDCVEFQHEFVNGILAFQDWEGEVIHIMETLDRNPNTLGAALNEDYKILTERFTEYGEAGQGLVPHLIENHCAAFESEPHSGILTIPLNGEDVNVYFRWLNEPPPQYGRYLLITGMLPKDASTQDILFIIVAMLLVAFTLACNYLLIAMIKRFSQRLREEGAVQHGD
jgi:hypothetical protein